MKILAGVHQPDKGQILISNKERTFRNYSEARKAGVGIVYQELSLLPDLTVAENIYMGIWLKRGRFIDWEEIKKKSKIILNEIGVDIDPNELVSALPMAIRQMVEIAKVLTQNPEIIIFDEPTAALSSCYYRKSRLF
jgi:ribose transport system ATP-binding protein